MTIFKEIKQKPLEYFILLLIFIIGGILFFVFSFDSHSQRRIIYLISGAYLSWSLYHHYRRGDLDVSIIVEYLIMVLLGIIVVSSTLF
jgi:hypothetical protein